jgi:DNA polymerase-3 subunit delta
MVAPATSAVAKFLQSPPRQICGFLFFGTDQAQVGARASRLAEKLATQSNPPDPIVRLYETELNADPQRIAVELSTPPLFGGKPIVLVASLPVKAQAPLIEAVSAPFSAATLIVQAPDMKRAHKIAQTFEAASHLAAIACYGEDEASLSAIVAAEFRNAGVKVEDGIVALIASRANNAAALALRETEKLIAFAGPAKTLSLAEAETLLVDQSTSESFEIANAALEGKARDALEFFDRFVQAEQTVVPVLSLLSSSLQRLHSLRRAVEAGANPVQAVKAFRPPLFFKQEEAVVRQLRLWTAERLMEAIIELNKVLLETRVMQSLAEDTVRNFLLKVAQGARPEARR